MAEQGADLLLSLICLTFLHTLTLAVHVDKGTYMLKQIKASNSVTHCTYY